MTTFTTIILFMSMFASVLAFACWNTEGTANRVIRFAYLILTISTGAVACSRAFGVVLVAV